MKWVLIGPVHKDPFSCFPWAVFINMFTVWCYMLLKVDFKEWHSNEQVTWMLFIFIKSLLSLPFHNIITIQLFHNNTALSLLTLHIVCCTFNSSSSLSIMSSYVQDSTSSVSRCSTKASPSLTATTASVPRSSKPSYLAGSRNVGCTPWRGTVTSSLQLRRGCPCSPWPTQSTLIYSSAASYLER